MSSFDDLGAAWRQAFNEAWASFQADNFGIGAVLVDPATGGIVAAGRNRVAQTRPDVRTLSGNMTAHAEMNAFASLDRFNADGLHLYTTLEPCLMCAATAMQLKVGHVHYAADDEFFAGLHDVWSSHPVTEARVPERTGPLDDRLARFARLLPMIFTLRNFPGRAAEELARRQHPDLAVIADGIDRDATFAEIRQTGTVDDALQHLDL